MLISIELWHNKALEFFKIDSDQFAKNVELSRFHEVLEGR